jgi:NADH-quinone oxidoreductase subunit C
MIEQNSMTEFFKQQKFQLENIFQTFNAVTYPSYSEIFIIVPREFLIPVVVILKNDWLFACRHLIDIAVIDEPGKNLRFSVTYSFLSITYNQRIFLMTQTNEFIPLQSIVSLFSNANWSEREIWDLYGLNFLNHPDLRRILTDYGFEGFPFRKDFPLSGYKEISYNDTLKSLKYEKVELTQAFRTFKYYNPWIQLDPDDESDSDND